MATQLFNRLRNGSFRPTVDRDTCATGQKLLCRGFTYAARRTSNKNRTAIKNH
jgi:hypothetical protein